MASQYANGKHSGRPAAAMKASVTGAKPPTQDLTIKQIQDEADDYAHMLTEPIVKFGIKCLRDYNYKKLGKLMLQAFRELDFPNLRKRWARRSSCTTSSWTPARPPRPPWKRCPSAGAMRT